MAPARGRARSIRTSRAGSFISLSRGASRGVVSGGDATAPDPNSSRLTSVKSTCFDSPRCLHHFAGHSPRDDGIGLVEVLDGVTMQVFVRDDCGMIAAPSNVTLMEYRSGRIGQEYRRWGSQELCPSAPRRGSWCARA
jgi:hypothetical protein